eukprot:Skav217951  [mRNA]  locus=scaffold3202:24457:31491:+ [translate_table: standard]
MVRWWCLVMLTTRQVECLDPLPCPELSPPAKGGCDATPRTPSLVASAAAALAAQELETFVVEMEETLRVNDRIVCVNGVKGEDDLQQMAKQLFAKALRMEVVSFS